ncbi:MAG: ABC transporter ATP-binding protein [Clostridia bacterium]|nr:ABC transporter ATP-binding protein [Clostridia bacterium]
MIEIKNVTKKFKTGEGEFYALNGVSAEIAEGEFVAVVGKSGSGKSTLLNLLGTLDSVSDGQILFDGKDISSLTKKELAGFRNKKLGFVFQSFYLEPEYTVYENVELPLILANSFGKANTERVENVLKLVGLADKAKSKAKNLSGGECQRTAIARAIVNDPSYILADEPCGNLDTANSENIMEIFKTLHSAGKTVIMVTHDEEEANVAQRIITLSDGRIVSDEKNT